MSYRSMVEMATSPSLLDRVAACLATFQTPVPRAVAQDNIWRLVANDDWGDAWQYAVDSYNINLNPDTGARSDVVTDEMIRAACATIHEVAAAREAAEREGASGVTDPEAAQDARDAETAPAAPVVVERPGVPPGQVASE